MYKLNKVDNNSSLLFNLEKIVGSEYIITDSWKKQKYSKGWRYGSGNAFVVVRPATLIEIWKILKICLSSILYVVLIVEFKKEITFFPLVRMLFSLSDLLKKFNLRYLVLNFVSSFLKG